MVWIEVYHLQPEESWLIPGRCCLNTAKGLVQNTLEGSGKDQVPEFWASEDNDWEHPLRLYLDQTRVSDLRES